MHPLRRQARSNVPGQTTDRGAYSMRKWYVLLAALVCAAAGTGVALASGKAAAPSTAVVKAMSADKVVINQYIQDVLDYWPGTVTVASGGKLTVEYVGKQIDPHTLTIVPKSALPKTVEQVESCLACQREATPHLKNPKAPPDDNNPIVHFVLNKGLPGLDTVGDSIALSPSPAHKKISVQVSAPAGT